MEFHRQAQLPGDLEHPLDLGRGKRQVFAECIDRVHQAFGCQGREHLGADMLDVVIGAILVLRRQRMGRQAGAAHGHRQFGAQTADHLEDLALAVQVQAIAGLDLDTGHAVAQQAAQALPGAGEQLVLTGGTGRPHGAGDTPTGSRDLGVAHALQALLELTAAVTAEHRVGMAIDQPRCHPGPFQIIDLWIIRNRQFGTRADPLDLRRHGHDGGVLDDRVGALRHACNVTVLPKGFHPGPPWAIDETGKDLARPAPPGRRPA